LSRLFLFRSVIAIIYMALKNGFEARGKAFNDERGDAVSDRNLSASIERRDETHPDSLVGQLAGCAREELAVVGQPGAMQQREPHHWVAVQVIENSLLGPTVPKHLFHVRAPLVPRNSVECRKSPKAESRKTFSSLKLRNFTICDVSRSGEWGEGYYCVSPANRVASWARGTERWE
jgi:hypothetical protein